MMGSFEAPTADAAGGVSGALSTFLFTDIEGSTRLWETHADGMGAALAQHDRLLRASIEAHGGTVIKTTGDGILAVFADPVTAIDAALMAQRVAPRRDVGDRPARCGSGWRCMPAPQRRETATTSGLR